MPDDAESRRPATSPEVLDWRLFKVEQGLDHVEERIGRVDIAIAEHGERMKGYGMQLVDIKQSGVRVEAAIARGERARYEGLWQLIIATVVVVATVIGSHFIIK